MEGSILELLEQHGSLAYEQIAAHLGAPPDAIRSALQGLRERGWWKFSANAVERRPTHSGRVLATD
jgi:predicted ArsR family transcriptional regulator